MTSRHSFQTIVTIGQTDLFQNMNFVNFFTLTGVVRELWVKDHVPGVLDALGSGLTLITRDASCTFLRNFTLYDPIRVDLWFEDFRAASINACFEFFHGTSGKMHAVARHTIVFADARHKPCRMPAVFREACLLFRREEAGALSHSGV